MNRTAYSLGCSIVLFLAGTAFGQTTGTLGDTTGTTGTTVGNTTGNTGTTTGNTGTTTGNTGATTLGGTTITATSGNRSGIKQEMKTAWEQFMVEMIHATFDQIRTSMGLTATSTDPANAILGLFETALVDALNAENAVNNPNGTSALTTQ